MAENKPTELEIFDTMCEAQKTLGIAPSEEFVTFMKAGIAGGKSVKALNEEWSKKVVKVETLNSDIAKELSAIKTQLGTIAARELQLKKTQLSAVVAETKKVDPTFDEGKFLAPFGDNTDAAILAVNTYMESIKHFKSTMPEVATVMHVGTPEIDRVKQNCKALFGSDDIDQIVRSL